MISRSSTALQKRAESAQHRAELGVAHSWRRGKERGGVLVNVN